MVANNKRVANDVASKEIKRLWGDREIVDAESDLRVFIREEDVQKATVKDAKNCVFAQACIRAFNAKTVLFLRQVAYVELPDEKGEMRVERFTMSKAMRNLVEKFDRGEKFIPTAGFLLKAPPPARKLGAMRTSERKRAALGIKPERRGNQGVGRFKDKPIALDTTVRNGSGSVHFKIAKEIIDI